MGFFVDGISWECHGIYPMDPVRVCYGSHGTFIDDLH